MSQPAAASIAPLLDGLADRIARRDLPPVVVALDPNDPAELVTRLAAALRPLVPHRQGRGYRCQARMLYRFLAHETQTGYDLAAAAGLGRVAGSHAHTALVAAGLLTAQRVGPRRHYRLSRWGEDWLLAVGRGEVPPPRPPLNEIVGAAHPSLNDVGAGLAPARR